MILWRVTDGKHKTEYIRANTLDEAGKIFNARNNNPAIEFQPTDEKIQAVYFTDSPTEAAYFKGGVKTKIENNNINWEFIKSCDKVIGELSFADMMAHKTKLSKTKQRNYKGGYSLSANTKYLLEVKNDYINGKISEEQAKAIFLKQKLCGNAI